MDADPDAFSRIEMGDSPEVYLRSAFFSSEQSARAAAEQAMSDHASEIGSLHELPWAAHEAIGDFFRYQFHAYRVRSLRGIGITALAIGTLVAFREAGVLGESLGDRSPSPAWEYLSFAAAAAVIGAMYLALG